MQRNGTVLRRGLIAVFVCAAAVAFTQTSDLLERADALDKTEDHRGVIALLRPALNTVTNRAELAEINWRLARATLGYADQRKDAGADSRELLAMYEEGEAFADAAIELNPQNPLGYYWKSSNVGRWGQTRGVLNSLARAPGMRDLLAQALTMDPEHGDSYFVLGQLYAAVPRLISFGNNDYAVSLSRKAVEINERMVRTGERDEPSYGFYLKLADHLYQRNWNEARRSREQESKRRNLPNADTPLERGWYFEGTATIPAMSDRDEARVILTDLIARLQGKSNRTPSQNRDLREARELLAKL
ncbi:MAG: hypothetical protein EA426_11980 [Spirochaetaceae bacterium]|nr:MAG: hypothetical protein EA426_11980 [Spirochaetaceae bacterium]